VGDFGLLVRQSADQAVIDIRGELDVYTAPQLREQLASLFDHGARHVVVELGQMDFIDSTGLSVLVVWLKRLRENDGDLTLRAPKPNALKVLEITGLNRVFDIT
jgi:anti-sigma B factor antagonist